jgi:nucleotide-binding universal stress UspA family protein
VNTRSATTKANALAIARHIVGEARRERVRARRARPKARSTRSRQASPPAVQDRALHVVVGVDGSGGSRRALTWAAREAMAHDGWLTVCWTGHLPLSSATGPSGASSAHGEGDRIVDELVATVAEVAPELERAHQQFVVLGPATQELVGIADKADLLVMAKPHDRHFAVQPSAAVTRRVITQSTCRVLLVP